MARTRGSDKALWSACLSPGAEAVDKFLERGWNNDVFATSKYCVIYGSLSKWCEISNGDWVKKIKWIWSWFLKVFEPGVALWPFAFETHGFRRGNAAEYLRGHRLGNVLFTRQEGLSLRSKKLEYSGKNSFFCRFFIFMMFSVGWVLWREAVWLRAFTHPFQDRQRRRPNRDSALDGSGDHARWEIRWIFRRLLLRHDPLVFSSKSFKNRKNLIKGKSSQSKSPMLEFRF